MSVFTVENVKSYTVLELLYQLMNEVENHTTIINQLKDEEKDDIQKAIDYLIQTGELDEIVGRAIEEEVFKGKDINHPPYRMDREPKRRFDDATVLTITNTGQPAEVMGTRDVKALADYGSRDGVLTYTMYTAPRPNVLIATGYTNNAVSVSTLGGLDICEGDIIDVMPSGSYVGKYDISQRMSSIVSHVDKENNIIFVNGWYSPDNPSEGQVPNPSIHNHVLINPITKIWNHNSIAVLNEQSLATTGVVCEYSLINTKGIYDHRLSGIDMVNFAGHNEACFVARSIQAFPPTPSAMNYGFLSYSDDIYNGFVAKDNETGFMADNCSKTAFKTNNERFVVNHQGAFEAQSLAHAVVDTGAGMIDVTKRPLSIITVAGEYQLTFANECPERFVRLLNTQSGEVKVNGTFWTKYGIAQQIKIPYGKATELYSNGVCWYVVNDAIG